MAEPWIFRPLGKRPPDTETYRVTWDNAEGEHGLLRGGFATLDEAREYALEYARSVAGKEGEVSEPTGNHWVARKVDGYLERIRVE